MHRRTNRKLHSTHILVLSQGVEALAVAINAYNRYKLNTTRLL